MCKGSLVCGNNSVFGNGKIGIIGGRLFVVNILFKLELYYY